MVVLLEAKDLHYRYHGGVLALNGTSIELHEGELLAVRQDQRHRAAGKVALLVDLPKLGAAALENAAGGLRGCCICVHASSCRSMCTPR